MLATIVLGLACNAAALLANVQAKTGGAAWKMAGEIVARGSLKSTGLGGTAEVWQDVRTGRTATRFTLPVKGTEWKVDDGRTVWQRDISGGIHALDAWYPRARAVTDAYIERHAYLSAPARGMTCSEDGDRARVRISPLGGIPAVVTIDTASFLIRSIEIRSPISTDITTFADYRETGSLVLPYAISYGDAFEPEDAANVSVATYAISSDVAASDFAKPESAHLARMLGRAKRTTVPIVLEGRQLLVWASIGGHKPMPFILDTGGHAILDSVAAKTLGIASVGAGVSGGSGVGTVGLTYARVASIRIGAAELRDQPMLVIPYPYAFYERGRREPLAGILGLEWFERFAARIDYAEKTLTLQPLSTFVPPRNAAAVPLRFQEDMPLARAAADGHSGFFGVDTGNAGTLVLYGDYLKHSRLESHDREGTVIHGQGTGGANTGTLGTLNAFEIGGRMIPKLDVDYTHMGTGSFSSWTEAGDLGLTVLANFTPVFDYASETLYLEPATHAIALARNRAGLAVDKSGPDEFRVVAVKPHSAAQAAGIVAGDTIVEAGGKEARKVSRADFVDVLASAAGTTLRLRVKHGMVKRYVLLQLR